MILGGLVKFRISVVLGRMGRTPEVVLADEEIGDLNIVGLVSDTHGVLDEETVLALGQATSTIIHAGDVSDKRYKSRLSAEQVIAKLAQGTGKAVVSVAGNVDEGCTDLPMMQTMTIAGKTIMVIHICGFPPYSTTESQELVKSQAPDIVVFGHSHVPGVQKHNKTIYINPGSAGPRRFKLPRCISLLSIYKSGNIMVKFVSVGNLVQDVIALPTTFRDLASKFSVRDSNSAKAPQILKEEEPDYADSSEHVHRKRTKHSS